MEEIKELGNNRYMITITGLGYKFECPINKEDDLDDVEFILDTLRKRLSRES